MAVIQQNKIYKGFSTAANPFGSFKLYDIELVRQDLLNQFNCKKGERVMHPEFGTIVWHTVFEPLTEELKNTLLEDIRSIIAREPRVSLETIDVTEFGQGLQFEISLNYVQYNVIDTLGLRFNQSGELTLI